MSESSAVSMAIQEARAYTTFYAAVRLALQAIATNDVDLNNLTWVNASHWGKTLTIQPSKGIDVRAAAFEVAAALQYKGQINKSFNQYDGTITYSFDWRRGRKMEPITIQVKGGTPRCKVRKVTKEIVRPAREASVETVETYEIENPEECGAAGK